MTKGRKPSGPKKAVLNEKRGSAVLTLAGQVIARRQEAGLTQAQLAKAAGLGHHAIFRLEKGLVDPKLSSIEKIGEILQATPKELLT